MPLVCIGTTGRLPREGPPVLQWIPPNGPRMCYLSPHRTRPDWRVVPLREARYLLKANKTLNSVFDRIPMAHSCLLCPYGAGYVETPSKEVVTQFNGGEVQNS
jgi:hypothetical protein